MPFLLNHKNVYDYLIQQKICDAQTRQLSRVSCKSSKNLNLLVSLPDEYYLVKQEHHDEQGKTKGELEKHWEFHELVCDHPELSCIASLTPEAIYFDEDNSIMILKYLHDYRELKNFYIKNNIFAPEIAVGVGEAIAKVHRHTLEQRKYQNYFRYYYGDYDCMDKITDFINDLEKHPAEVSSTDNSDARKFLTMYRRYPSFKQALEKVNHLLDPCCLIHNDFKLSNVLVHYRWEELVSQPSSLVKIIDWEKWAWGDPRVDLGQIISSYLRIWLNSLVIGKNTDMQNALNSATTPLETIQPSLVAMLKSYLAYFPEILARYQDFLPSLAQFTGLALIDGLEADISYQESFTNNSICILQVAKTLLCTPRESVPIIFGQEGSEQLQLQHC